MHVRPSVTVRGADADEQARRSRSALARFRDAGLLLLPIMVVEFHDDQTLRARGTTGCSSRRFRAVPGTLICNGAEYVLTHELAHAWEAANLDRRRARRLSLEYRGTRHVGLAGGPTRPTGRSRTQPSRSSRT